MYPAIEKLKSIEKAVEQYGRILGGAMENDGRGRIRWLLVIWMFVLSAVGYLDRVNISIAGIAIAHEFRLNNLELGWIFSSFVIGYALFQAPGGRLADRFGARGVLTIGVAWWCVFTALTAVVPHGFATSVVLLLLLRFLLGLGAAVMYPSCNRTVASWIPVSERGAANGLIFAGVGAGAGITPPLITWIMIHYGWRWSFWVTALLGAVVGPVWYLISRNTPEEHPWVSQSEAEWIAQGTKTQPKQNRIPWRILLVNKNVLALTTSYFCYGYSAYIFFSWFFLYLVNVRKLNLKTSAYYSMLPFLAMAVGSPLGGFINDVTTKRFGQRAGRSGIAVTGMLLAAIFISLGSHAANPGVASWVLAGGAGALYLSLSSFWSATADIAGASAGSVSGIMNMGNQIGGVVTASVTPALAASFGWTVSFSVAAALCTLGAFTWLLISPAQTLAADRVCAAVTSTAV